MKQSFLERYAPPGIDVKQERTLFLTGLGVAGAWSLSFFHSFNRYKDHLYTHRGGQEFLREGAIMEDFVVVLGKSLWLFFLLALCMIAVAALHYAYHHQGSKSIYLMHRLPDRMELHRRCLTLPVLAILITLAAAFLVLVIYFAVYMCATPPQCLTPGQWQKIWR